MIAKTLTLGNGAQPFAIMENGRGTVPGGRRHP